MRQLFLITVVAIFVGCKPDSKEFIFPEGIVIKTISVTSPIDESTGLPVSEVTIIGEISSLEEGITVLEHGFVWGVAYSKSDNIQLPDSVNPSNEVLDFIGLGTKSSTGKFQSKVNISGISQYSQEPLGLRAYALTNKGIVYGELLIVTNESLFDINIGANTIAFDGVNVLAQIDANSNEPSLEIVEVGFVWIESEGPNKKPTLLDYKVSRLLNVDDSTSSISLDLSDIFNGSLSFSANVFSLSANTLYRFRAYAITKDSSVWYSYTDNSGAGYVFTDVDRVGWVQRRDFPGNLGTNGRSGSHSFVIADKVYYGLGSYTDPDSNDKVYPSDFWEFDTETNSWTRLADFPGNSKRNSATSFSIGNRGYYGVGLLLNLGSFGDDIWQYDPALDTWAQITNFPGTQIYQPSVFVIGSKAYLGAGINPAEEFWSYDGTTNSWSQIANFSLGPIQDAITFSLEGKGYVGFGRIDGSANKRMASYDPASDTWTGVMNAPDFLSVGTAHYSFSILNKGYIGPGTGGMYEYNPMTNVWLTINKGSGNNWGFTHTFTSQRGYIINGYGSVFEFNP